MMHYRKFFIILLLSFALLTTIGIEKVVKAQSGVVDLECIQRQILDPSIVCETQTSNIRGVRYVEDTICSVAGFTCDPDRERCIEYDEVQPAGTVATKFGCKVIFEDPTFPDCVVNGVACNVSGGKRCMLVNLYAFLDNPPATPQYRCVDLKLVNIFGVDLGPLNIFLPKFIRLGFTMFFVLIGFVLAFQLFGALWSSSTAGANDEAIQNAQKQIVNSLLGLFFIAVAVVVVQVLASLFGVTGSLFDFRYP